MKQIVLSDYQKMALNFIPLSLFFIFGILVIFNMFDVFWFLCAIVVPGVGFLVFIAACPNEDGN